VFDLDRVSFEIPGGEEARDFYVLHAPDWINIIPLTNDRRVVLVRQFRHGIEDFTLEIPGGMCDEGEAPIDAARREMREESGYEAREIVPLGWVHPNPAIQGNGCHSFLASSAYEAGPPDPDPNEQFEVTTVPIAEIPKLIEEGRITHSLVIAAFHLYSLRYPFS
jgi:8-oxo-dGTP pyrophosphatase MutT (NUDIX family)